MSQNEVETIKGLVKGMSTLEQMIVAQQIPDEILIGELNNRLLTRGETIAQINKCTEHSANKIITDSEVEL